MNALFVILFFFTCSSSCNKNKTAILKHTAMGKKYTYLALGDSYTIGEMVPTESNFPNQAARMMRNDNPGFMLERIIAKTGWTTDELAEGIASSDNDKPLLPIYDFVSLLIGVNNQYRGRSVENYKIGFEELLKKAIRYAGNRAGRIVVLSIPDWGVTPFADGRDREQIAREIDAYNAANKMISEQYGVHYINITAWTREAATDNSLLAADGLHPSAKEYKRWAEKIAAWMKSKI